MSVGGFLVSPTVLNKFWGTWARAIDYQAYVFQGMMINEFSNHNFECARVDGVSSCMYQLDPSKPSTNECEIPGQAVLNSYNYRWDLTSLWVGILLCIVLGYRLLTLVVLWMKRT